MEREPILKIKDDSKSGGSGKSEYDDEKESESEHAEAVGFVEKHRDFFEHYARGRVRIEPAPKGLSTFAFDLERDVIYVNSMFYKKQGFSDEKTLFAICHEIEHFLEKKSMLLEDGGEKRFERYLKRIKSSRAFSLIDNCNGDIRENRSVVSRTNQGMGELETLTYKEDLFPETDFTKLPRHIQFSQALLREARVPDEKCQVSDDVRQALDGVVGIKKLMEIMTNPETPMSLRLRLQDKYLWPKIEALLEKDIEDKRNQRKQEKEEREKEQGDSSEEGGGEEEKEGQEGEQEEDKEENGKKEKGKKNKGDKKTGENENEDDPNKIFDKEYTEAEKKFPEALPTEEIEKAFKEWQEKQKAKTSPDKMDEEYAKKIGVEKKDLQDYRKMVESLKKITNPETNIGVVEELRNLFSRIISKRLKMVQAPRYPVEEGEELVDPAQLVSDVKSGNLQPKVWEDTEIKEKRGDRFGEVEVTLVCDRSGSMEEGQKAVEQQKSAVLVMEVLKEFAEVCEAEKINVDKPLEVRSEVFSLDRKR